jgi:hypothetical protein
VSIRIAPGFTISFHSIRNSRDMVCAHIIVDTPYGPIENTLCASHETIRQICLFIHKTYAAKLYDFITANGQQAVVYENTVHPLLAGRY